VNGGFFTSLRNPDTRNLKPETSFPTPDTRNLLTLSAAAIGAQKTPTHRSAIA
jgi:hypothetical protein